MANQSFQSIAWPVQGSGKDLIQPVLDNQLKAASPLVIPAEVRRRSQMLRGLILPHAVASYVRLHAQQNQIGICEA